MAKIGVLIIHGTFGSPHEFTELESFLRLNGYSTHAISLPGHGDEPSQPLSEIRAKTILRHCKNTYKRFAQTCDEVIVVGHSLGAICTLNIAGDRPEKLKGVISLSAPYEHAYFVNYPWGFLKFPVNSIIPGLTYVPQGNTGCQGPDFKPWWFPKLYQEAHFMLRFLQRKIPRIQVPVFLAHSPHDMIVPYAEMQKIANRLSSPENVTMHTFQKCGHQIFPHSDERYAATGLILQFLKQNTSGISMMESAIV